MSVGPFLRLVLFNPMRGLKMIQQSTEVVAEEIKRYSEKLWSNLPADLVPEDEAEGHVLLDKDLGFWGLAFGDRIFRYQEDATWVGSGGEMGTFSGYRNGELLGSALL